jgi:uncharacterized coiled-coil protein SlyX
MKWISKRKLKARIAELEAENTVQKAVITGLKTDVHNLCENYNSEYSIGVRLTHNLNKALDIQLFEGDAMNPETKGMFNQK